MEKLTDTRRVLEEIILEYQRILSKENPEDIDKVLSLLERKRKEVKLFRKSVSLSESQEVLDENVRRILELMKKFSEDIKLVFVSNGEMLSHITTVPPEMMAGGRILRSRSRANNYETESGDWTFASSEPLDGKNLYVARKPHFGMIHITPEVYIYGGNNLDVVKDETGKSKVLLKYPNYAYIINPQNFMPVVTLKKDKDGKPYFEFSEEWTSGDDIDITDKAQVSEVKEIKDVTEIIRNYQIFCDVNLAGIAHNVRLARNIQEGVQLLKKHVISGDLRYINSEADINVHPMFSKIIPSLKIDMNLDEFEIRKSQIIEHQNEKLQELNPSQILAYKLLVNYRKVQNSLALNGSFKKELAKNKTPEEIEENRRVCLEKIKGILEEAKKLFGENVTEENLESILESNSQEVFRIIQECMIELKQASEEVNLILNSCIYVSPDKLEDGMLKTSKNVLNVAGEVGDWVFAQSGTLVDNPYLLRKSGKGVFAGGNMCMPGDTNLVTVKNKRAYLTEPVYVYLMKTQKFNPVVSVDYMPDGKPGIYFDGEWTSDNDIPLEEAKVESFLDITEMLEYIQLFTAVDSKTFMAITNIQKENAIDGITSLIVDGALHYINGECGIGANEQLVQMCQNKIKTGKNSPDNRNE